MPNVTRARPTAGRTETPLTTVPLRGVEVLAPGVWNGDAYTVADLTQMAETFTAGNAGIVPPAKLGHNPDQQILARDGLPAAGYVQRLYVEDGRLKADFRDVPKRLAALIRAKAYSKVSAEVYFNLLDSDSGQRIPRVLKAVSFLGADVPAVTSLADIEALYGADAVAAYYSETESDTLDGDLRVYELPVDMSHDDLRFALRAALLAAARARNPFGEMDADDLWVTEVYDGTVIVCAGDGSAFYRVAYTVGADGQVTLGETFEPVKRTMLWAPLAPQMPVVAEVIMSQMATMTIADGAEPDEDFEATLTALLQRMDARHKGAKGMPAMRTFVREMRTKLAALRRTAPAVYGRERQAMAEEEPMNPELLKALGLAEGSDDAAVLAKVAELSAALDSATTAIAEAKAQITAREGQYASLDEYRTLQNEVGSLKAELSRRDALSEVERAVTAGKVMPAQRAWAEAYAAKDIDGFRSYAASAPAFPLGQTLGASGARGDGSGTSGALNDAERNIARQLGMAEEKLVAFKERQPAGAR